jgi:hypothetical protein
MSDAPAGWYPSSSDPNVELYWTGSEWITPERLRAGADLAPQPPEATSRILSILGLIAGVLGVFLGPLLLFSIAAIVLGFAGRKHEPAARGLWLSALLLGFIGLALGVLYVCVFIVVVVSGSH